VTCPCGSSSEPWDWEMDLWHDHEPRTRRPVKCCSQCFGLVWAGYVDGWSLMGRGIMEAINTDRQEDLP
jgi:hypothetical protein